MNEHTHTHQPCVQMRATWGDSDGSPSLLVRLELLARLWGLMVPRWEHCWVGVGLQLWWRCCCWERPRELRLSPCRPATFHLCVAVNTGHSGLAEQRKKAGVLGKHRRLQHKEDPGRWTSKRSGWWKGHFSRNRNEGPWSSVVTSASEILFLVCPHQHPCQRSVRTHWQPVHAGEVHAQSGC